MSFTGHMRVQNFVDIRVPILAFGVGQRVERLHEISRAKPAQFGFFGGHSCSPWVAVLDVLPEWMRSGGESEGSRFCLCSNEHIGTDRLEIQQPGIGDKPRLFCCRVNAEPLRDRLRGALTKPRDLADST